MENDRQILSIICLAILQLFMENESFFDAIKEWLLNFKNPSKNHNVNLLIPHQGNTIFNQNRTLEVVAPSRTATGNDLTRIIILSKIRPTWENWEDIIEIVITNNLGLQTSNPTGDSRNLPRDDYNYHYDYHLCKGVAAIIISVLEFYVYRSVRGLKYWNYSKKRARGARAAMMRDTTSLILIVVNWKMNFERSYIRATALENTTAAIFFALTTITQRY